MLTFIPLFLGLQSLILTNWELLADPRVQVELALNPSQTHNIRLAMREAEVELARRDKVKPNTQAISHEGKVLQIAITRLEAIGESLTPSQRKRVLEIGLQRWGPGVLHCTGVPETLGITRTQAWIVLIDQGHAFKAGWDEIVAYSNSHRIPLIPLKGGHLAPTETPAIKQIEKKRDDAMWAALRRDLNPAQYERLVKLLGRPFPIR